MIYNKIILATVMEPRLFDLDLQLLADVVLMIIAVFVLFFVASYNLFNPARAMLEKRRDKIRDELDKTAADMASAATLKEEYEAKLKNIDAEAEEILGDARKRALASESKILAEAKADAARIIERARVEAELEKQKAADDVKREIVDIAALMAAKVVTASINTTIQEGLINDTLKEMGKSTWLS
ncbi:MAG: F0F1 ATP synthase subunit B [Lachnospiraceae bacterium]|jgi:F-type H+-transporting ATPase subunit b|nr:F0F1 ATP synthase subunit B [Lachnospiraceae bacterium]